MPNYVTNRVTLVGATESVKKILDSIREVTSDPSITPRDIDFNRILPMPPDVLATADKPLSYEVREASKGRNWYDWCIKNWGTKWNAMETYVEDYGDHVVLEFQTAGTYPSPVLEKLAKMCYVEGVDMSGLWCDEDYLGNSGTYDVMDGALFVEADETAEEHRTRAKEALGWTDEDFEEYEG